MASFIVLLAAATGVARAGDVPPLPAPKPPNATPASPPPATPAPTPDPTPTPAPHGNDATPAPNPPSAPVAAPTASATAPKIVLEKMEHNFGFARQNEKKSTRIKVKNEGGAPLHVTVHADCGCSGVVLLAKDDVFAKGGTSGREIAPGDEAQISLTFDTTRFFGPITKTVHVNSDDPTNREVVLQIKIDVSAGVVLVPQNFFFNASLFGSKPTSTMAVKWMDGVGKPFKITAIEPTGILPAGTKLDFHSEPFDEAPWHGFRVTMSFTEPPAIGMVTGTVNIRTDDPDTPQVSAPLGGVIVGKVIIAPAKATFSTLAEGKGGTRSIQIRPFDGSIDLGKVTVVARKGAVKVTIASADEPQLKGVWTVALELPKDAPLGVIEDVIDITTEVKGYEKLELPVTGTVVAK
jgi:hypothetical protein